MPQNGARRLSVRLWSRRACPLHRKGSQDGQTIFRNRRRARHGGRGAHHARLCAAARTGRRARLCPSQQNQPRHGAHRQGHACVGLHARSRLAGRFFGRRRRYRALWPRAHAGRCLPHPSPAFGRRCGDQRQPQPLSGQRHQVLRGAGHQAPRRHRGGNRSGNRQGPPLCRERCPGQSPPFGRRLRPLRGVLQEHLPDGVGPQGHDVVPRLRPRGGLSCRARGVPRTRGGHRRRGCRARRL